MHTKTKQDRVIPMNSEYETCSWKSIASAETKSTYSSIQLPAVALLKSSDPLQRRFVWESRALRFIRPSTHSGPGSVMPRLLILVDSMVAGAETRTPDLGVMNYHLGKNVSYCLFKSCSHRRFSGILHFPPHPLQSLIRHMPLILSTDWPHLRGVNPSVETVHNWHTCSPTRDDKTLGSCCRHDGGLALHDSAGKNFHFTDNVTEKVDEPNRQRILGILLSTGVRLAHEPKLLSHSSRPARHIPLGTC